MGDYQIILSRDLLQYSENDPVCVTGIISDKWGKEIILGFL